MIGTAFAASNGMIAPKLVYRPLAVLLSCTLVFPPSAARARPLEDIAALDALVTATTGVAAGQPGGAVKPIDRRFRLAKCNAAPLAAYHGKARESLRLSCPDAGGWSLFVPLVRQAAEMVGNTAPGVSRGEAVAVQIRGNGFTLSARGETLAAAEHGEPVAIRLAGTGRSAKRITAIVVAPGTVALDLR